MNQDQMIQASGTQLLHGWLSSIALHSLLLLGFFLLFRESVKPIPEKFFHWDVSFVQSTPKTEESAQTIRASKPAAPKQPFLQTRAAAHTNQPIRHSPSTSERIAPVEAQGEASVAPELQPGISSSESQEAEAASTVLEPTPNQPQASDPQLPQADAATNSTIIEPSRSHIATAASTEAGTTITETAQSPSPPVTAPAPDPASTTRPDYGWLQQAIFRRLEQLKLSSRPFLAQSQPLKVLIRAVVSSEGILLASEVVKSSGLDPIDQEAMTFVQRAFPMQLERPLERQQVAMRIPITYSRE